MAVVQRGKGQYLGVAETVDVVSAGASGNQSADGIGTFHILSYTLSLSAEKITTRSGASGAVSSEIYYGHEDELTLEIEFYGASSIANATSSFLLIPSPGSTLTVTVSGATDTRISGAWVVQSSSKTATTDGIGKGQITCRRQTGGALAIVT